MAREDFWTADELTILRNMCGKASAKVIALTLGRSEHAIRDKARRDGMSLARVADSDAIIKENAGIKSSRQIAKLIGRDDSYVRRRMRDLGLVGMPSSAKRASPLILDAKPDLDDEAYVTQLLALGGFPVACLYEGKTVWVYPAKEAA